MNTTLFQLANWFSCDYLSSSPVKPLEYYFPGEAGLGEFIPTQGWVWHCVISVTLMDTSISVSLEQILPSSHTCRSMCHLSFWTRVMLGKNQMNTIRKQNALTVFFVFPTGSITLTKCEYLVIRGHLLFFVSEWGTRCYRELPQSPLLLNTMTMIYYPRKMIWKEANFSSTLQVKDTTSTFFFWRRKIDSHL